MLHHTPSLGPHKAHCSRSRARSTQICAQVHYDVAIIGGGPAGLSAAAALRVATSGQKSVHVFEKTSMKARGAAILVGVNGLKALQAINPELLRGLLSRATKLEGSGESEGMACVAGSVALSAYLVSFG